MRCRAQGSLGSGALLHRRAPRVCRSPAADGRISSPLAGGLGCFEPSQIALSAFGRQSQPDYAIVGRRACRTAGTVCLHGDARNGRGDSRLVLVSGAPLSLAGRERIWLGSDRQRSMMSTSIRVSQVSVVARCNFCAPHRFWTKDKILKRRVNVSYTPEEFVATLAEHVPNRYQHAIGYFGLLAPGSKARTSAALFLLLGQEKRPRPRRL